MPYRIDLHAHTGHSSDSLLPAACLLRAAAERGLSAIAVTDHNSLGGAIQAASLVRRHPESFGQIMVIMGEEVKTTEGEIMGLFLHEPIPRDLTPEETIRRMRDQGGLVVVPHPFDRIRHSRLTAAALDRVAHLVDAIEVLNARTTLAKDNHRAQVFAAARHLLSTAGSDAHVAGEVGTAYLEIDEIPGSTSEALLRQLETGRVCGRLSSPLVHVYSKIATWRKKLGLAPTVQL
jgi:predicted metal-dependent phosphoesterase TrpH